MKDPRYIYLNSYTIMLGFTLFQHWEVKRHSRGQYFVRRVSCCYPDNKQDFPNCKWIICTRRDLEKFFPDVDFSRVFSLRKWASK